MYKRFINILFKLVKNKFQISQKPMSEDAEVSEY